MSTDTFSTLSAVATLVALALAAVALVCIARPGVGLGAAGRLVREQPLALGATIAAAAMLGSLYYSEVAGFVPCDYCWYQRIAMYPLAVVLGIAAVRKDRGAMYYALPIAVIGFGIAVYHYQLQLFPEQSNSCNLFAPCTQQWVDTWGFISIPFMAGAAFLTIGALGVLTIRDDRRIRRSALGTADGAAADETDGRDSSSAGSASAVVPSGPPTR